MSSRPIDTSKVFSNRYLKRVYQCVQPSVESLFGFSEMWAYYDACAGCDSADFARKMLEQVGVTWSFSGADIRVISEIEGPIVFQSNHVFGAVDSFVFMLLLEKLRPDSWRMLSNYVIASVPQLKSKMIAVDALGSGEGVAVNMRGLMLAVRHLKGGGILGLFPGRRVAYMDKEYGALLDFPWTTHGLRLAGQVGASIVNLHVTGQNSDLFLKVPTSWVTLRSLMLCRELTGPNAKKVSMRVASIYSPAEVKQLGECADPASRMRADCFLRADVIRKAPGKHVVTKDKMSDQIIDYQTSAQARHAFAALSGDALLFERRGLQAFFFRGDRVDAAVMQELGRCREYTFRRAGQGVGQEVDLSPEDAYYYHLVLWSKEAECVIGAYRVGDIQEIIQTQGCQAIYLDHVFDIKPAFYEKLGSAYELSRSFVMPAYQRDPRALAGLWKGLSLATKRESIHTLFGSVTISNDHQAATRSILVEYLKQNHADALAICSLVEARKPFVPETKYHKLVADAYRGEPIGALTKTISQIENDERGIPPLMRYYCSLGAKFIAYHVEASFKDALYCLLRVDLRVVDPLYRKKFS